MRQFAEVFWFNCGIVVLLAIGVVGAMWATAWGLVTSLKTLRLHGAFFNFLWNRKAFREWKKKDEST